VQEFSGVLLTRRPRAAGMVRSGPERRGFALACGAIMIRPHWISLGQENAAIDAPTSLPVPLQSLAESNFHRLLARTHRPCPSPSLYRSLDPSDTASTSGGRATS